MVDGFRPHGARGISEGVKGTAAGGGEDKERSGTGAALTPKRRALEERQSSTGTALWLLRWQNAMICFKRLHFEQIFVAIARPR